MIPSINNISTPHKTHNNNKNMKSLLLAISLVLALHYGEAAPPCGMIIAELYPCVSYLVEGGRVSEICCNGVRAVNSQAQTTSDRQSVCRCIKSTISRVSYSSNNVNNALSLPSKCGINLPYKFSPSTNCDSIH